MLLSVTHWQRAGLGSRVGGKRGWAEKPKVGFLHVPSPLGSWAAPCYLWEALFDSGLIWLDSVSDVVLHPALLGNRGKEGR